MSISIEPSGPVEASLSINAIHTYPTQLFALPDEELNATLIVLLSIIQREIVDQIEEWTVIPSTIAPDFQNLGWLAKKNQLKPWNC